MIEAKIVADSLNPQGDRLTTFVVTFPRIILAEFNTHRMFSRNSASSRAIPFEKMVKSVKENPFIPIAWQKDHKGMQGTEYITDEIEIEANIRNWIDASKNAIFSADRLNRRDGVTKQLCNRLLEPFMWHTVIITSGKEGLENFFNLRNHEAAEIHIQELAKRMLEVYNESTPKQLKAGEYHIPYGDTINVLGDTDFKEDVLTKIKIATARCARVSYTTVGEDGKEIPYEKDIALNDSLLKSGHFSPFEHAAVAMSDEQYHSFIKGDTNNDGVDPKDLMGWCFNYRGFIQYRYMI